MAPAWHLAMYQVWLLLGFDRWGGLRHRVLSGPCGHPKGIHVAGVHRTSESNHGPGAAGSLKVMEKSAPWEHLTVERETLEVFGLTLFGRIESRHLTFHTIFVEMTKLERM